MRRKPLTIYTHVEQPHPIRVFLPYTRTSSTLQTVVDCLRIQRIQPELVKVADDDSYWRLLRDAWANEREFFVVEQDVIVWQNAIPIMAACEERWCTLPTMCHGRMITTTFGCVKFGVEVIERNPGFWDDIPDTWYHLDANFADKAGWPFLKPHVHIPAATHLNEVQWPDEVSTRFTLERKIVWQSMEAGGEPVVNVKSRGTDGQEHITRATVDSHG